MKSEVLRNELLTDKNENRLGKTMSPDYTGHNLVFVVGCPRSGTTWLQRLLTSHPKIQTGQESHIFDVHIGSQLRHWRNLGDSRNRGGVGLACYFTEEEFLEMLRLYLLTLLERMVGPLKPDEVFLEKTPTHGLFLPEIVELLPQCRIIHMLRDPRDVVSSLIIGSRSSDAWISWWAPVNTRRAAGIWVENVEAVRAARQRLPSWQFQEVRYEELSQSPETVLKACADFVGFEWDRHEIAAAVENNLPGNARASGGGTPIPLGGEVRKRVGDSVVEPERFIRKAKVGSWQEDLNLLEQFGVWKRTRELMPTTGYHWSPGKEIFFAALWRCLSPFWRAGQGVVGSAIGACAIGGSQVLLEQAKIIC